MKYFNLKIFLNSFLGIIQKYFHNINLLYVYIFVFDIVNAHQAWNVIIIMIFDYSFGFSRSFFSILTKINLLTFTAHQQLNMNKNSFNLYYSRHKVARLDGNKKKNNKYMLSTRTLYTEIFL